MPVLAVQQFRCKTCRDTGVVQRMVVAEKNPHNAPAMRDSRPDSVGRPADARTGQHFGLVANDRTRFVETSFPCAECPPEPPRKRDWVR